MDSFDSYLFRQAYRRVGRLGDGLARVDGIVDWEAFRPIVSGMFVNDSGEDTPTSTRR